MKAITLKQPWASLIFNGKDIENRSWKTKHRGPVFIHAGKTWDGKKGEMEKLFTSFQQQYIPDWLQCRIENHTLPTSAILGIVDIVGCEMHHQSKWAELGFWNWVLANPRKIVPIEDVKGKQGLWDYDLHYSVVPINPYENIKVNYEM